MMDNATALSRANAAFVGSTTYFDANIRPQVERDLRAFQGRHDSGSKYLSEAYRSRSRIFRPKIRGVIRKNEAIASEAFFSTLDLISVEPEDERDPRQQASAEIMQALLQYRLKKSIPWFQVLIGAYQDAQTVGVSISHQDWEYNAVRGIDRPTVDLIPVENFRFDPGASWTDPVGTSPYLIWLLPMYAKDVRARMLTGQDGSPPKWALCTDSELMSASADFNSTRLVRDEQRSDSRDRVTAISDYSIVWVRKVILGDDEGDVVFYTLGGTKLLSAPAPLQSVYGHGRRPFVVGCSVLETHRTYPSSEPKLTRDLTVEINELANQRIDNVKLVLNKRFFVARNKQVDLRSLMRTVPGGAVLMNDPHTDVRIVETPDVTSSSYSEQDRLNLDFDDITGNFSTSSVQSNRALNETVGGLDLINNGANQISNYKLMTFIETWVEPVLRQLVLLEQCYETNEVILAMAAGKSAAFERLGADSVTDEILQHELSLSVNAGRGTTSPTQRINALLTGVNGVKTALGDGVLERYGVNSAEIIKAIFGALGHKDGGRFFYDSSDPRVTRMQQKIQQLQQQLGAKHPPELLAAQVALLQAQKDLAVANKVKAGVDASYGAMQAGEVIAMAPQVAPVADKVMQTAGYQLPTPPGVDPHYQDGLPQGMTQAEEIEEPHVALDTHDAVHGTENTHPEFPGRPVPLASPFDGGHRGIETQRADGVRVDTG